MTTVAQKLLLIARDFPPDFSPGVPRIERFARNLPESGWQPLILAMEQEAADSQAATKLDDPSLNSIIVERCRMKKWYRSQPAAATTNKTQTTASAPPEGKQPAQSETPARPSRLRPLRQWCVNLKDLLIITPDKAIGWVSPAVATGKRMIREHNPQAIMTSGPPHSIHLIGRRLKLATGLPWVADFRDPWARRPWGHKKQNPWGQNLYPWFERRCVETADRVILNTEAMADDFRRFYPQWESKFLAIPNGCDGHLVERIEQLLGEIPARSAAEPLTLTHAGSLYRERDPRPLIEAIALLNQRGIAIRFEQIGNCSGDFNIPTFLRDHDCGEYVSLTPPVPRDEALRRMAAADLLLLIQPGTDLQIPGKLFEMLPFRKPILAVAHAGATADVINQYQLGAVATDHTPQAMATVLENLIQHRQRSDADLRWDKAIHDFDGRTLTAELAATLNAVTSGSNESTTTADVETPPQVTMTS
ncbi:D-inositol-3-phosphate glycosyltransferase [Symmachiella dynata]|uniref:D-inositol-3-phosphate glycosyltransferase n=1 Tax=Symmachiella dynata TaxID=2527995 RepID=A0A517ZHG3_9PLAN|nr:glycosyltransferase [Symmachiella dynata]QDU41917.1 D-inositol-3-phosphate glycosyltransferase [Symmachiella dynata]